MDYADLVQEGILGVTKAIDKFDPDLGYKFSTYASWWTRHRIQRALVEQEPLVKCPVHVYDAKESIRKIENRYFAQYGELNNEKIPDIIKKNGLRQTSIKRALDTRNVKLVYLDASVANDDFSIHNLIPSDSPSPLDDYESKKNQEYVKSLLKFVTPIESAILKFRFGMVGDDLTLQEIGDMYSLSRERIRQIEQNALDKIRKSISVTTQRTSSKRKFT